MQKLMNKLSNLFQGISQILINKFRLKQTERCLDFQKKEAKKNFALRYYGTHQLIQIIYDFQECLKASNQVSIYEKMFESNKKNIDSKQLYISSLIINTVVKILFDLIEIDYFNFISTSIVLTISGLRQNPTISLRKIDGKFFRQINIYQNILFEGKDRLEIAGYGRQKWDNKLIMLNKTSIKFINQKSKIILVKKKFVKVLSEMHTQNRPQGSSNISQQSKSSSLDKQLSSLLYIYGKRVVQETV